MFHCILRRILLMTIIFLACLMNGWAQSEQHQDTSKINYGRLALVGGITSCFVIGNHIYQREAWWQGNRAPFHFENDWDYAVNFDKWGHLYATGLYCKCFTGCLEWSGLEERPAKIYGSFFGLAYELYVELEDGYHSNWGFSPGDAISDITGATYPILQSTFPVLKNFNFKWSYIPSKQYLDSVKTGQARTFVDDYEGMINWVAIDPHFMMGEELRKTIPSWLGLAVGFAARDLDQLNNRQEIYYISLDYNFSKIETSSDFLKGVFWVLDNFHLPAPGISIDNKKVKVGLFF